MMVFSPLDEEQYEDIARKMTYWKVFEYILEDFVSREDSKVMMKPANLPVSTTVATTVNTAVTIALPSPAGTGIGAGTGSGNGTAQPVYVGDSETPGSVVLKAKHKAELEAGGATVEGFTAAIESTGV